MEEGIGWQLMDGHIVARGPEAFQAVVKLATSVLGTTGRPTAATHMHEALQDLSRRPQADLPGAVYHAMGSLECVVRDLAGNSKATLGEALRSIRACCLDRWTRRFRRFGATPRMKRGMSRKAVKRIGRKLSCW